MGQVINLKNKLDLFQQHWSPKVIAEMNDCQFKLAKVQGEFVWHQHDDTDEVFFVVSGQLHIAFNDEIITLNEGELYVVPKGVKHKPYADKECHIMLIEPKGVINTGEVQSHLTANNDIWV